MKVFIIKHYSSESPCYVLTNSDDPKTTPDIQKAFRFGTRKLAEDCCQRLRIPVAWDIIEVEFDAQKGQVFPKTKE